MASTRFHYGMAFLLSLVVVASFLFAPAALAQTASAQVSSATDRPFKLTVASVDATSVRLHWRPVAGASEYEVTRDGTNAGRTIGMVGYFTDFDLRPGTAYRYRVAAYDQSGTLIGNSNSILAKTTRSTTLRSSYKILAVAFNPERATLRTERTFLKHRIQFLHLASLGSAKITLYHGGIVDSAIAPNCLPGANSVDYIDLVSRRDIGLDGHSIVDLVENGEIDHVWIVKSPVDFSENALIGNRGIQGPGAVTANSWIPIPVKSSRSFFVNAYLPDERAYDAYAHMVEGIMTTISDGYPELWPRDLQYTVYTDDRESTATREASLNLWEQFRLTDGWNGTSPVAYASPGNGNLGSSHFPPTTSRDCENYCYFDHTTWQRYVDSAADDWLGFPNFSKTKRKLNGYDFGAFNNYAEGDASYSATLAASPELHSSFMHSAASFHQWWFGHLPHGTGVSNGLLNNWWPYIFDFNRFDGAPIDFQVRGFQKIADHFPPVGDEYGTNSKHAQIWGYWNSQNGFSPGAKSAELRMVSRREHPHYVRSGSHSLKVSIENGQYWEHLGAGRNDVFYPASRNAHWSMADLAEIKVSIRPDTNKNLISGTNPIIRLYRNGGNRIEFVPRISGAYANLFLEDGMMDSMGWYNFTIPLAGNATWEKNLIGYVDPNLPATERQIARAKLEGEILSDINYVEISIRSTTSQSDAPLDTLSYYIDSLELRDAYGGGGDSELEDVPAADELDN